MGIFNWFGRGKAAEVNGSTPALTPEGAAHGLTWDTSEYANYSADLYHNGDMKAGIFEPRGRESALVDVFDDKTEGGITLGGKYPKLEDGMKAAEEHALHEMGAIDMQPHADASESYYAKLSALAESREVSTDRDLGNGFDLDR